MERKKASDFDPDVLILFDAYVHGAIDRRGFLHKASKYAAGGMTAAMMLDALNPKFAEAQQVAKDDGRIKAEYVPFPSPQGNSATKGYLVRPANAKGKLPGVLVVHENRGLNPTSRTLRAGWPWTTSSRSRRTRSRRSAGTRATRTRRGSSSPSWIRRRRGRISSPRAGS
jgi:hypothetical protein